MPSRRLWIGGLLAALAAFGLLGACGSSSAGDAPLATCEGAQASCAPGTTCWAKDCVCPTGQSCDLSNCVPRLTCLPSAQGKKPHDPCNNTVGTPTCSDDQACVEFAAGRGGCLSYCDDTKPNRGCVTPETCVDVSSGATDASPVLHVCGVVGTGDGGTDDGGDIVDDAGVQPTDAKSDLPR